MLFLRLSDAFPKGDALPKAKGCIPPGMLSPRSFACPPQQPKAPAASSAAGGVGSRVPPREMPQGSGTGRRSWGAGGGPAPLPAASPSTYTLPGSPARPWAAPLPSPMLSDAPSPSASGDSPAARPRHRRPRLHPCSDRLHRQTAAGDPSPGFRRLHSRCHERVAAPSPPLSWVRTPEHRPRAAGGGRAGRFGRGDGKQ